MSFARRVRSDRYLMGRLSQGGDLLGELLDTCARERVTLGRIEAVGSVRRARLAFYNQSAREYRSFVLNRPMEIVSLSGSISLKEGAPFVHAHVVLSDETGASFGGHLVAGTEVFSCEFLIEVLDGPDFVRTHDEGTGLQLWAEGDIEP